MHARLLSAVVAVSVLLGGAATAQTLKNESKLSPDGSEVLAEGPFVGTVEYRSSLDAAAAPQKRHPDAIILFVTQKGVYFREKAGLAFETQRLTVETMKTLRVSATIKGEDKKSVTRTWQLTGEGAKEMVPTDPKAPPVVTFRPEVVGSAAPSKDEIDLFHFHALARLQQRADTALYAGDDRSCDSFAQRGTQMAAAMRKQGYNAEVGKLYGTLPDYLAAQQKGLARTRALVEEQKRDDQEFFARKQAAYAKRQSEMAMGFLSGLVGALANSTEYRVTWSDGSTTYESEPDFVGGAMTFMGSAIRAESEFAGQMQAIEFAQSTLSKKRADEFTKITKALNERRKDRTEQISKAGWTEFRVAPPTAAESEERQKAVRAKDDKKVIELMEAQVKRDQGAGKGKRDNPYALVDLYHEQAVRVSAKDAEPGKKVLDWAEKTAAAARLVPKGDLYNFDRLEVLRTAAAMVCLAATYETATKSWGYMFSPRAAYAVRVLDNGGALDGLDVTGEARQQRAMALLMLGQRKAALDQLKEVESLRKTAADYQIALARVLALNALLCDDKTAKGKDDRQKMLGQGLDAVEQAMKFGFCQLKALDNSDFKGLREGIHTKRFDNLRVLDAGCSIQLSGDDDVVFVKNNSKFALQNVRLNITAQVKDGKKVVTRQFGNDEQPIPSIPPDGRYPLELAIPFDRSQLRSIKVSLVSDQGKKANLPVAVPK